MNATPRQKLCVVLLIGLLVRLLVALQHSDQLFIHNDEPAYWGIAKTLVSEGKYLMGGYGTTQILRGPTYPGFLAGLIWIFGEKLTPVLVAQAVIGTLLILILSTEFGRSMRRGGLGEDLASRAEILVAGALALSPPAILYEGLLLSEGLVSFLLVCSVVTWIRSRDHTDSYQGLIWVVVGGICLGAVVLAKPAFLPFVIMLPCVDLAFNKRSRSLSGLLRGGVMMITALVVLFSWTIRNYYVTDSFGAFGIGGGIYLYSATLPMNTYGVPKIEGEDAEAINRYLAPGTSPEERIAIDEGFRKRAVPRIFANPQMYLYLCLHRAVRLWVSSHASAMVRNATQIPRVVRRTLAVVSAVAVLAAIFGILLVLRMSLPGLVPFAFVPIYTTAVHTPIMSGSRYSVPAWPYVLCFAAFALAVTVNIIGKSCNSDAPTNVET